MSIPVRALERPVPIGSVGVMGWAFLLTSLVIVAIPGTGVLITIGAGLARGARSSLVSAFGCTLGIVPHLLAAVTGAAALLAASGEAFLAFRILGVAYLAYMAWTTWRNTGALTITEQPQRSAVRVITLAILANLLNPKLTLFFFAFLPQFVPAGTPHPLPAMLELSGLFMAMTFVVFAGYGIFAAAARRHLIERPRVLARLRKVFAVSFLGLGAKLATTR
jgi:threonine/homoserine/homoserine lactone efflux protein